MVKTTVCSHAIFAWVSFAMKNVFRKFCFKFLHALNVSCTWNKEATITCKNYSFKYGENENLGQKGRRVNISTDTGFVIVKRPFVPSFTKYLRKTLSVMWNSTLQEKFNYWFSGDFYWCWQNFHFGRRTEHRAIILRGSEVFLIFPNFLRS